jgi:hypothetical protein
LRTVIEDCRLLRLPLALEYKWSVLMAVFDKTDALP